MAAIRYKAKVRTDGTVILPRELFAPGTEVEVLADSYTVEASQAGPTLVRIVSYDPLVTETMEVPVCSAKELAAEEQVLKRLAVSDAAFWDNEADNAAWNDTKAT
jgi:hypothetical protein